MFRKALCLSLMGLLLSQAPAWADTAVRPPASAPRASSTTKRVAWTLVGVGAGFAAGLFVGLSAFDDSIHSDRKVWTSVIVGAAAGGLAGGLISRNVGRGPQANSMGARSLPPDLRPSLWPPLALSTSNGDEALRRRVREVNVSAVAGSPQ
jgi:hypothetical protein